MLNESTTFGDPPSVVRLEGAKAGSKGKGEDDLSIRIEVIFPLNIDGEKCVRSGEFIQYVLPNNRKLMIAAISGRH